MSRFTMEIECGNAAFDPPGPELARILRELARRVEVWESDDSVSLSDVNGNLVGAAWYDADETEDNES